jgi:hypothetical protein
MAEHIDVDPQPLAAIWGTNQIIFVYMTGIGILVAMAALTLLF